MFSIEWVMPKFYWPESNSPPQFQHFTVVSYIHNKVKSAVLYYENTHRWNPQVRMPICLCEKTKAWERVPNWSRNRGHPLNITPTRYVCLSICRRFWAFKKKNRYLFLFKKKNRTSNGVRLEENFKFQKGTSSIFKHTCKFGVKFSPNYYGSK